MSIVLDNNKIGVVGEYLKEHTKSDAVVSVPSPIFTIYAFEELKEILENCKEFRFLFNEPTFVRDLFLDEKEVKEFELKMARRERNVSEFNLEIGLKNNLDQNQIAARCYEFIKNKAQVKSVIKEGISNIKNILVENKNDSFFITGGNLSFSRDGLGYTNEEKYDFNQVVDEETTVEKYKEYFANIFNNNEIVTDVKEALLNHLSNLYKENSPELLYFLTLYNIFNEKLLNMDDMARVKEKTGIANTKIWNSLYNFQHDAVVGAIKKIELFNGCIIADSVGLGKTFEALAIIKYYELRNCRVLVLCPKKLRNNWTGFKQNFVTNIFAEDRFRYDVLNHTDLSRKDGHSGDIDLTKLNWGNYDLVVIDESHNFRNDSAVNDRVTRYKKLMYDIIKSGVRTKVLMLSATPVNNGLTDLKNQIRFITEDNDNALYEQAGIKSIETTLKNAQKIFKKWLELPVENRNIESLISSLHYDFFNLLDSLTIARSRKHIKTYYNTKDIGDFPQRNIPITLHPDIDVKNEFPKLATINKNILRLTLAVYMPICYVLPEFRQIYSDMYDVVAREGKTIFHQEDRDRALVGLMRVNLLKRMESSVNSFNLTLTRILEQIDNTLKILDKSNNSKQTLEVNHKEFEDEEDEIIGGKVKVKLEHLDILKFKQDLIRDKEKILELLEYSRIITPSRDLKLSELKKLIAYKIKNPLNVDNKKIIIFTSFSDTAEYLYKHLSGWILKEFNLTTALVTGTGGFCNNENIRNDFESILVHFSPKSNYFDTKGNDVNILIATDCISEGQNLQDCDYLINYDIHWNPVRIVQRFGRIDRIGSKNKIVQLVNFWPNIELDEYINLEKRVRGKMSLVNITATGDDDIIDPEASEFNFRKSQLEKLQKEVMDIEDMKGGINITDLTMDDFILALDKFVKEHPHLLEKYPTGVYAVTNIEDKISNECTKGVIFCLKQTKYAKVSDNITSLSPYYLVYVDNEQKVFISNTSPKKILDIYKVLCLEKDKPIESLVKNFNKETKNGVYMDKYTELLEVAINDIKGIVKEKGIKSIFQKGKALFFKDNVEGINDFELVSFLVVV